MMVTALLRLADDERTEMSRLIDDAGPIAGLFVLVLAVALYLLWRSLNKQIKRIDPSLPQGEHELEQQREREDIQRAVERGEDDEPHVG